MARMYAKVVGLVVLLIGIVGLIAGDQLIGVFNIEIAEDIIHLGSGGLLVYLLVGILGFIIPKLLGLLPEVGYTAADNILHLTLGVLAILAARDAKDSAPARSHA